MKNKMIQFRAFSQLVKRWAKSEWKKAHRSETDDLRSRLDRALKEFLQAYRDTKTHTQKEIKDAFEVFLQNIKEAAPSEYQLKMAITEGGGHRFFWNPLIRLFPKGDCWNWAQAWAGEHQTSLRGLGLNPENLALSAIEQEAASVSAFGKTLKATEAFEWDAHQKVRWEGRDLSLLGVSLLLKTPHCIKHWLDLGLDLQGTGLLPGEIALAAKHLLWPEVIESLLGGLPEAVATENGMQSELDRGSKASIDSTDLLTSKLDHRLMEECAEPWLDFSWPLSNPAHAAPASLLNHSDETLEERVHRCATALCRLGANPNQAPLKTADHKVGQPGRMFPLEAALKWDQAPLTDLLIHEGANPEDARVKGRLDKLIQHKNTQESLLKVEKTQLLNAAELERPVGIPIPITHKGHASEMMEDRVSMPLSAAGLIENRKIELKRFRDQQHALWKLYQQGALFDQTGQPIKVGINPPSAKP